MASTDTTVSAAETLREALKKHHLRLAQPVELSGQRYVLECKVCGEVTEIQPWQQIMGYCAICRLWLQQSPPTFHVLLPDSVPVPEEKVSLVNDVFNPNDAPVPGNAAELEHWLQTLFVQNEAGTYDRVRKHQLEPRHTHYWDDERSIWVPVVKEP